MHYVTDAARRAEAGGDGSPDAAAAAAAADADAEPPPELCVGEGFDAEQVWLQMDLQLVPVVKLLKSRVGRLLGSFQAAGAGRGGSGGGGGSDDGGGSSSGGEEDDDGPPATRRRRRRRGRGAVAALTLVPPAVERDIDELLAEYEGPGAVNRSGSGEEEDDEGEDAAGFSDDDGDDGSDGEGRGAARKRQRGEGGGGEGRKRLPFEDRCAEPRRPTAAARLPIQAMLRRRDAARPRRALTLGPHKPCPYPPPPPPTPQFHEHRRDGGLPAAGGA
jgi:hypothetical protein